MVLGEGYGKIYECLSDFLLQFSFIMVFFSYFSNHPIVLGPNNTNLPKIFSIIAEGEMHEAIKHDDPCAKRLANVVRQVQVS